MARAREWPAARAAAACGLTESQILTLARWMAEADPLVLAPGNGLERGRNGGSGIRAAIALPALLGKFGKGSGIVLAAGNAFPKTLGQIAAAGSGAPRAPARSIIVDFGRHLAEDDIDPPLRALFIYNHNPIVVHPDQNRMRRGLARDDVFSVGIEVTMTESMTPLRRRVAGGDAFRIPRSLRLLWPSLAAAGRTGIPPLGESLPNTEIFRRLAARFGFDEPCFKASDAELMDEAVDAADPRLGGVRPSEIPTGKALPMTASGRQADGALRERLSRRHHRARSS